MNTTSEALRMLTITMSSLEGSRIILNH